MTTICVLYPELLGTYGDGGNGLAVAERARRRGVDVEVVMTEDPEWTAALERLASAGVHVHVLGESQIYIHSKVICADCTATSGTVFIGSENFSTSSLSYNRELGVITSTPAAVRAVRAAVAQA